MSGIQDSRGPLYIHLCPRSWLTYEEAMFALDFLAVDRRIKSLELSLSYGEYNADMEERVLKRLQTLHPLEKLQIRVADLTANNLKFYMEAIDTLQVRDLVLKFDDDLYKRNQIERVGWLTELLRNCPKVCRFRVLHHYGVVDPYTSLYALARDNLFLKQMKSSILPLQTLLCGDTPQRPTRLFLALKCRTHHVYQEEMGLSHKRRRLVDLPLCSA